MAEERIGAPSRELYPQMLANYLHTGAQADGVKHDFEETRLEKDECCEICYIEVISPIQADGTEESLKQVIPVIDGAAIEEYINLEGTNSVNMSPPRINQLAGPAPFGMQRQVFQFGTPQVADPVENTTLKAKSKFSIRTFAGTGDISADYRIRIWGYKYKTDSVLREIFGDSVYGAEKAVGDLNRGTKLTFTKDAVKVGIDSWDTMVGGVKQRQPQVMPILRYARNANATSASVPYEFNYVAGDVADSWENMFFDFGTAEALVVRGLGVKSTANLAKLGLKIGDRFYPYDLYPAAYNNNPFNFGHGYPIYPEDVPFYMTIPQLAHQYLISNIKGRVVIVDNGASISPNDVVVALQGVRIELP